MNAYEIPSVHIALMAARRRKLVIDLTTPENQGGRWLNAYRAAREAIRRAVLKQARRAKKRKKS